MILLLSCFCNLFSENCYKSWFEVSRRYVRVKEVRLQLLVWCVTEVVVQGGRLRAGVRGRRRRVLARQLRRLARRALAARAARAALRARAARAPGTRTCVTLLLPTTIPPAARLMIAVAAVYTCNIRNVVTLQKTTTK